MPFKKCCIYAGNKQYVAEDKNGEVMYVTGMINADTYESTEEAEQKIKQYGLDGVNKIKIETFYFHERGYNNE